jgi:hypothetical protein
VVVLEYGVLRTYSLSRESKGSSALNTFRDRSFCVSFVSWFT